MLFSRLNRASLLIALSLVNSVVAADEVELRARGAAIYKRQCAKCHGTNGEGGTKDSQDPLVGDLSVGELTKVIAKTMPEGKPKNCVGENAQAVARFIHFKFYSPAARLRNRPPRIELARLTGNQLRQSLADLANRSSGSGKITGSGLKGEYYDGARPRRGSRKIERVDSILKFDFTDKGPGSGINPKDYYIRWRGGIKADVTGRYEFVIRSSCAFMMNLGGSSREFINNRVQSGDKHVFRRSIVLTAGRVYPLQIEFWQRKRKTKQPPANISLSWVPPQGTEQIVPALNLVQFNGPATFSLQAKLPPDDRSFGFVRGTAVDRQWSESTTSAAIEFAQLAVTELWPNYLRRNGRGKRREALRRFLVEIVEVAFRGPVDDVVKDIYVDQHLKVTKDDAEAIKRSVLITLKSPRFLYPLLDSDRDVSQRAANRLALTLLDSLPSDSWLRDAVRKKQLVSEAGVRRAAQRLVSDHRVRGKTRDWLYEWLNLKHLQDHSKDESHFPKFNAAVVSDLRRSFDTFLDHVVWEKNSDYRQFFVADWTFTNERLEKFYGDAWRTPGEKQNATLRRTVSRAQDRFGVLSHPYLMSGLAYRDSTSPIHRGVFLLRHVLGRNLRPPNEAFTPLSPKLHPKLTTRERIELQTSPQNCQACHTRINGLGFLLENFDAVGRFRKQENGKAIRTDGEYTTASKKVVKLAGPAQLARFLAESEDAHRAFVRSAFEHFVKQPMAAYGPQTHDQLVAKFRENNYRIPDLLVEIAVVAAMEPQRSNTSK